jgi:kumamolisin
MSASAAPPPSGRLLPAPKPCGDGVFGFDPRDIASYYGFPDGFDGTGTSIAFVSLSGALRRSDVDTYFSAMPGAAPAIEVNALPGSSGNPAADAGLALSLELLGSAAPGAGITVYEVSSTEQGVVEGLSAAVHGGARPADVVCLTWTIDEASVRQELVSMVHEVLEEATALGLPVCAPAGVWAEGILRPVFPGTHPSVLACGATRAVRQDAGLAEQPMVSTAGQPSASNLWPMDPGQAQSIGGARAGLSRRVVPDVSALAGGEVGYRAHLNGKWGSVTGPGAAACLWAALIARLRQALGRPFDMAASINRTLGPGGCLSAPPAPRPGTGTTPVWDSRVGWGSPNGERILAQLGAR